MPRSDRPRPTRLADMEDSTITRQPGEEPTRGVAWITLSAIIVATHPGGKPRTLVCHFKDVNGAGRWTVTVTPGELQSFGNFQKCVAAELFLWIRHACENERTGRQKAAAWSDAVEVAWGAAT